MLGIYGKSVSWRTDQLDWCRLGCVENAIVGSPGYAWFEFPLGPPNMMFRPQINCLLDADIFGYHWDGPPKWWAHWERGPSPWERRWGNIRGFHLRCPWFGLFVRVTGGVCMADFIKLGRFRVGAYWVGEYQRWLEYTGLA